VSDALERVPASSLIVSDRADLCVAYGLGGVQLPASGLPVAVARAACGPVPWVGASVHDTDELDASRRASGLLVSPIWPTASKPGHPGIGLAGLAALAGRTAVPVYALGGVTPERVSEVVDHGAYGCAALSPFCDRANAVESAARAFARAFERA
jgi:thiamine-phosphate diphosphorylase